MKKNGVEKPWSQVWDILKPKIVLISALMPLIMIAGGIFLIKEPLNTLKLSTALIAYQLAFIITLLYDVNKRITSNSSVRITKIRRNDEFWTENEEYSFLYLFVLTGDRFLEMIDENNIHIKSLKLIVPNDDAINIYFNHDPIVNDKKRAANIAKDSISTIEDDLKTLHTKKLVDSYEIRRIGTFPLDFFAIFDGQTCLAGKYTQDALRKNRLGLKSISWTESTPLLVSEFTQHFETLWDSLGETEKMKPASIADIPSD